LILLVEPPNDDFPEASIPPTLRLDIYKRASAPAITDTQTLSEIQTVLESIYNRNGNLITSDKMSTFTAILHKEEDMYVAECPEVGTVGQGKDIDEAINDLKEATELYLEEFPLKEDRKTLMTTFEVAVSAKA